MNLRVPTLYWEKAEDHKAAYSFCAVFPTMWTSEYHLQMQLMSSHNRVCLQHLIIQPLQGRLLSQGDMMSDHA